MITVTVGLMLVFSHWSRATVSISWVPASVMFTSTKERRMEMWNYSPSSYYTVHGSQAELEFSTYKEYIIIPLSHSAGIG